MKISSLGPHSAPHSDDLDRELELEVHHLANTAEEPLEELGGGDGPSDEDQGTQEGLIRLVDFLQAKARARGRKKPPSTGNQKRDLALTAYQNLGEVEDRLSVIGQNLRRRV